MPWLITITGGGHGSLDERPDVYAGDDEDGAPEEEEDRWSPLPVQQPRVAVLAPKAPPEPPARAKAEEPPPEPVAASTVEDLAPTVVSALPPIEGGTGIAMAALDPLAFLEVGFGVEPDPDVEDPEDGAPEDPGTADGTGDDNDGLADASEVGTRRLGVKKTRARPGKPRAATKPPCTDDNPGITEVEPGHWTVQRSLVEYYATHPLEFEAIATYVITHKDGAGAPDGFKVGLRRCGVLWETGFRSGDVVHAVNARTISTIMQAIGAYFALRDEHDFVVNVTRKGGTDLELRYTLIDDTRADRHLLRDFLREARQERRDDRQERRDREREERRQDRSAD